MIMKNFFPLIMLLLCLLPAQTVMGQQHRRGTKARRHVIQRTRNNPKTFKAPTVNKEMVEKEQLLYDEVDEMPEFPGGINGLMTWLGENVSYPEESEKKGVQGTVVAMFVVESDGSVSNAEIEKSVDPLLDLEVLELIAKPDTKVTSAPISRLQLPRDIFIGGVIKPDGKGFIANGNTLIEPNDRVVVFCRSASIKEISTHFRQQS